MRMPKLMQAKNYLIPRPLRCKGLPLYRPASLQVEWLTLIATLLTAKNQTHFVTIDFQYHNITIMVIWDFLCLLYNLLFEDLNASIHTFDFVSLTHLWLLISNTITVTWEFFSVFCLYPCRHPSIHLILCLHIHLIFLSDWCVQFVAKWNKTKVYPTAKLFWYNDPTNIDFLPLYLSIFTYTSGKGRVSLSRTQKGPSCIFL